MTGQYKFLLYYVAVFLLTLYYIVFVSYMAYAPNERNIFTA